MANRAYLYSDDRPDAPWYDPDEDREYYDSRWGIPLAWFYFFRPHDVQLFDIRYGDSRWQDVRLSAEKGSALALFEARKPLLMSIIGHRISSEAVEKFVTTVGERPGRFLLMDPGEVLDGVSDDEQPHAGRFAGIFEVLGDGEGPSDAAREATHPYVDDLHPDSDRYEGQVLGYTYS